MYNFVSGSSTYRVFKKMLSVTILIKATEQCIIMWDNSMVPDKQYLSVLL